MRIDVLNKELAVPPLLGFAAHSGTGKTTLLVKLIPLLKLQGLRVGAIKYTHHDFEIDKPGKDSYRIRQSGADQVLLASNQKSTLFTAYEQLEEQGLLTRLLHQLDTANLDIVLVEGFRRMAIPKIELHRQSIRKPLLFPYDKNVIAVASDEAIDTGGLPLLNLNEVEEVAGFINRWLGHFSDDYVESRANM